MPTALLGLACALSRWVSILPLLPQRAGQSENRRTMTMGEIRASVTLENSDDRVEDEDCRLRRRTARGAAGRTGHDRDREPRHRNRGHHRRARKRGPDRPKGTTAAPGRNVRAKAGLNRSILEQSWGAILDQLVYKAAWAGRRVVTVRAAFTSQDCSACGKRRTKPDGRERWQCENCHKEHDRDVNAAINIHRAGMRALGSKSSGRAAARAGNTA